MLSSGEYYSGIDPDNQDELDAASNGTIIYMLICIGLIVITVVPNLIEIDFERKTQTNKNESVHNDSIKSLDTLYSYAADVLKQK